VSGVGSSTLVLDGVRAGYGSGPDILNGVSLTLGPGMTCCVIGPNGAGKSTILKVVAGLLKPRAGTVTLDGERIDGLRPDQVIGAGVCLVPQDRSLFPDMTVRENLRMAGYLVTDRRRLEERLEVVHEMFPILAERSGQNARTLSGGQQQLVALARALILEPRILLVDEPSLGLAPLVANQIFDTIRRFKELGMTILLVEQNARKGLECADVGFVVDLGRERFQGPADTILAHPEIRELYLGRRGRQPKQGGARSTEPSQGGVGSTEPSQGGVGSTEPSQRAAT
jgi:branched-chain amino acid transport system ATP-binding protein